MPKLMCSRLVKIQRDFLWGGGNLEQKPHLVNWKTVCSEKNKGGLGVRNLSKLNQTLLCKWCWRFANERDPLGEWRLVSNLERKMGARTPATLGEAMELVYGRTSE